MSNQKNNVEVVRSFVRNFFSGHKVSVVPGKVNRKCVNYRLGDCLSIDCKSGKYLAALISKKFNNYYDLTLLEYYKEQKPQLSNFINGKFFGTRFGSWTSFTYALNIQMIECKYIDDNTAIEKVGSLQLTSTFTKYGYEYLDNVEELLVCYLEELPVRIEKTKNAQKFPALAFMNKHLIDIKYIIE
jgi:hypothetical protein